MIVCKPELLHSPATILQVWAVKNRLGSDPILSPDWKEWPVFVGSFPDTQKVPDKAICIYDTSGFLDGRCMRTGNVLVHEGINIRVRGTEDYDSQYLMARNLFEKLAKIRNDPVVVKTRGYRIKSFSHTTPIASVGETELRARKSFVLNGLVSITQC